MKELKNLKVKKLNTKELYEIVGGEDGWYYFGMGLKASYYNVLLTIETVTGGFMPEPGAGGYTGCKM